MMGVGLFFSMKDEIQTKLMQFNVLGVKKFSIKSMAYKTHELS